MFYTNEQWYLLQDNDPKHTSILVQQWLFTHGVTVVEFPSYSPDLNCLENLWFDLAERVEKHNAQTMDELQDAIAYEWDNTSIEFVQMLVHTMPSRCRAVIQNKGEHTHY